MPGLAKTHLSPQRPSTRKSTGARPARSLLLVDNAPLQHAAWAKFTAARKLHDKVARDLHRHEQEDIPAYDAWLHRTFPVFISTLRDLHEEVFKKARSVQTVQAMASLTGRSLKKLWREQKAFEANPEAFRKQFEDQEDTDSESNRHDDMGADSFESDSGFGSRRSFDFDFDRGASKPSATASRELKAIYRRLVQHLHPDRGGPFTPVREKLWHEVQQAWAARDADWLARIEVEWETANDVLGPTSPLSRLLRAIEEMHAARRDTERKLREYRGSPPWRFTRTEARRAELHRRTEANFQHDLDFLQRQLAHLNATIAAWERPRPRATRRRRAEWYD